MPVTKRLVLSPSPNYRHPRLRLKFKLNLRDNLRLRMKANNPLNQPALVLLLVNVDPRPRAHQIQT